jgi:DNA repair protein SbcD/Mre11
MSLKLLHIADVHLDAPFRWLGAKGQEQRRQLKATFRKTIDLALAERVDCLLIAGDLFDSNSPAQDTVDLVQAQLARLACPVFILPGTHDCLDETSIYRRTQFGSPHVHLFDAEHVAFAVAGIDLVVQGRANVSKTSRTSPLRDLRPSPNARYNVALAHGSLVRPGTEDDFPIAEAELAVGMDYVALGHWHTYRQCGGGRACYSGPPEVLGEGEDGRALLVELGRGEPRLEPRRVSQRRCAHLDLPLDGLRSAEEVVEALRNRRDPDLVLGAVLSGLKPLDLVLDADELARELAPHFFAVRVEDRSHPIVSQADIAALPEHTVLGQYARHLGERLAAARDENELHLVESALQLGLALLKGRRVL